METGTRKRDVILICQYCFAAMRQCVWCTIIHHGDWNREERYNINLSVLFCCDAAVCVWYTIIHHGDWNREERYNINLSVLFCCDAAVSVVHNNSSWRLEQGREI
jgi:hypothetical protein